MARFAGKLHTWNEERGFGFIRPVDGGQDIFVHVSALPRPRPQPDEVLTFEVGLNPQGKKKAMNVRRQAVELAALAADAQRQVRVWRPATRDHAPRRGSGKFVSSALLVAVLCALAWQGYRRVEGAIAPREPDSPVFERPSAAPSAAFSCDGRTRCTQMSSCEEAHYFLKNCPGAVMDGDGDGVPCERGPC